MSDNLATVAKMYEAFGRGDGPGMLACLADDVKWEPFEGSSAQQAGVPWLQARRGKPAAGEFFQLLATFKWHDFRVIALMAGDQRVAAELEAEFELPDGTRVRDQLMHQFMFNEAGEVVRFRHYVDTGKAIAAYRRWQAAQGEALAAEARR